MQANDFVFGNEDSEGGRRYSNWSPVEEVIVNVQHRQEKLQNVPVSVTRYSDSEIVNLGVSDFSDIAASTPGVTLAKTGIGGARYFIRGLGQVTVNQSPTTGIYFDNTPLQVRTSFGVAQVDPRLFDIQTVEVLRGPQGSLFGSSSMGGAIRIISNQPDVENFGAEIGLLGSSTKDGGNNGTLSGVINIPLGSNLSGLRVATQIVRQDGFIDDVRPTTNDIFANIDNVIEDIDDIHSDALRASYKISPSKIFDITASVLYQDQHADQQRQSVDLTFPGGVEARSVARYMDTFTDDETAIYSLTSTLDLLILGGISIVSATSYMDRQVNNVFDLSPFGNGGIEQNFPKDAQFSDRRFVVGLFGDTDIKQFSQEFRFTSTWQSQWQYLVGLFYKDVENSTRSERIITESFGAAADPIIRDSANLFEEQEVALFGELSRELSDTVKITFGGRLFYFDHEEARRQFGVGGEVRGSSDFDFSDSGDESGFSPRAVISYTPNKDSHFYVNYSAGFRSGGINAPIVDDVCSPAARVRLGIPALPDPYESDRAKSTELGTKLKFLEGRISVSASAYTTDWEDYQLSVQQDCGGNSAIAVFTANAGDVSIDGYEFEVAAYPVNQLRLAAGFGYTDAVFDGVSNPDLQARGIEPGSRLFDVPEYTWNLQIEYSAAINDAIEAYAFSSAHYVDESESGFGEGESPTRPDYTLVNARFGVSWKNWDTSLFIDNVTDENAIYGLEFTTSPSRACSH